MNLLRVFACLAISQAILAQAPVVTDTKLVSSGGGKKELLRKINGRWFSQDNREVYPPGKNGVFWELDSKPGVVDFFHHRPFQLDLAESLHLFMQPAEVEALLGQPNRIFGTTPDHAFWYYYANNGTKLDIRFMGDGLGEAEYATVGEKTRSVASIERELNGRSIYSVLAERAGKRSQERLAKTTEASRIDQAARSEALRRNSPPPSVANPRSRVAQPRVVAMDSVSVPQPAAPQPPVKKRIVSAEALAAVAAGDTRQSVLTRLGEPTYKSTITSDDGTRESLTYHLESGEPVVIRLVNGKVVEVKQ